MPDPILMPAAALSPAAMAQYDRDGYVVVDAMTSAAEVATVRAAYDRLFAERRGYERGEFFDTRGADDGQGEMRLPQMFWPSRHEPALRDTLFHRRSGAIARQILGERAELVWEFAILKPARHGAETPWHQDEAFFGRGTEYQTALSFWLPLQDVGPQNGCMEFVPGSHRGRLYVHRPVGGNPRAHGLEAQLPGPPHGVACPLRVGQASIHHSHVLHHAGPNPTDEPRRAWILEYAVRDPARRLRRDHPWNRMRETSRDARELAALPLGARLRRRLRRVVSRIGL